MSPCIHCKRWDSERDGACRLCRLCLAISQIAGQPEFTPEDFEDTSSTLAGVLGNLTSSVLLVPRGSRSTAKSTPASGKGVVEKESHLERDSRRGRTPDRSRDRRRRDRKSPEGSVPDRGSQSRVKKEEPESPRAKSPVKRVSRTPSPRERSRDRRRRRRSSPLKKEKSKSPERVSKEIVTKEKEKPESERVDKSWVPQLRPRDFPSAPPPPKVPPEVVLKKAPGPPPGPPPEPSNPPSDSAWSGKEDHSWNDSGWYPPVYSGWKGKGKGKFPSKGKNGGKKGYRPYPNWESEWGWGWDNSWETPPPTDQQAKKKNRGVKRDHFIGNKIDARRAQAKARSKGQSKGAAEDEGSQDSEGSAPAEDNPPRAPEVPPGGIVIAEETAPPSAATAAEAGSEAPHLTAEVPEPRERWADATEGAPEASGGGGSEKKPSEGEA